MSRYIETGQPPRETGTLSREIILPTSQIYHHMFRRGEVFSPATVVEVIPTESGDLPVFPSPYYLANVGTPEDIRLLELRFEHINSEMAIALLMTNERYPRDLTMMAERILVGVSERGIAFDAVVAPESLGPKLSQEIATILGPDTLHTTLQKGKVQAGEEGTIFIGSPKQWVGAENGVVVSSGTSNERSRQMLFLDPKAADVFRHHSRGVLLVDDARLTKGTVDSSIRLLRKHDIPIAAVATVLNEAEPVTEIETEDGMIPYIWLVKLPLFHATEGGMQPIPGTYDGLEHFYREQP